MEKRLRFQKGDILAILLVLVLAVVVALLFIPRKIAGEATVEIYQNGTLLRTLPLSEENVFFVEGEYINTVTIENGEVSITASNCPGEDCVHSGEIHTSGRSIVCLPNGVEVRVVNAESDVDFVVG